MRALVAPLAFSATALHATLAFASTGYPAEIETHLALTYVPKCALCHDDGDAGPTDTPFAKSMIARGLNSGGDLASVDGALDAMKKDRVDSDGDGAFDLDELSYGGDPNHADEPQGTPGPAPMYGCAMDTRGARDGRATFSLGFAFAVIAIAHGRKRCAR